MTKFGSKETVLRIRYNGILNKPPIPNFSFAISAEDTSGFTVDFDASATIDPENDSLTYKWDFGDGTLTEGIQPTHRYGASAEYQVLLTVTDTEGQAQQVYENVQIGVPPRVKILSPAAGDVFEVDQVLHLKGEAIDFLGNPIPERMLVWEVRQHHADHFHPFMGPTDGNDFDLFPAPVPEDYLAATNSFLEVLLTATDSNGVSTTVSRVIQPRTIMVNIRTEPPGLEVIVDDYALKSPMQIISWVNFNLPLRVQDQPPYIFKSWSGGSTSPSRTMSLFANMTNPTAKAIFCVDLWTECSRDGNCCSGRCNSAKRCAPVPTSKPPSHVPTRPSRPLPTTAPLAAARKPPNVPSSPPQRTSPTIVAVVTINKDS